MRVFTHTDARSRGLCTGGTETIRARPEFTSLMYVLGGDRSLSHELLIVRRHNSPRASHPLSVSGPPSAPPSPPTLSRRPAHSSPLCTSALEIRACARSPAVTDEYVLSRAEFTVPVLRAFHFSIGDLREGSLIPDLSRFTRTPVSIHYHPPFSHRCDTFLSFIARLHLNKFNYLLDCKLTVSCTHSYIHEISTYLTLSLLHYSLIQSLYM